MNYNRILLNDERNNLRLKQRLSLKYLPNTTLWIRNWRTSNRLLPCIQFWICTKTWWAKHSSNSNLISKISPLLIRRSSLNWIKFLFHRANFYPTVQVSRGLWACLASRSFPQKLSNNINKRGKLCNWRNLTDLTRHLSAFCQANFPYNLLPSHLPAR